MKITIDTKEDSHEEIKKVIRMLSSLVGEQEVFSNQSDIFSDGSSGDSSQQGSDIFNILNNNSENKTEEEKAEEDKKEDDIDLPELEEYR
mgnify:CR=1 FL=1